MNANETNQVAAEDACPNCGERDADLLVWLNDEDEQVQCKCGMVYKPENHPAMDRDFEADDEADLARDFETMMYEVLQDEEEVPEVERVETFEEAGVLTNNRGLVVTLKDGSEYQVTIVQSR